MCQKMDSGMSQFAYKLNSSSLSHAGATPPSYVTVASHMPRLLLSTAVIAAYCVRLHPVGIQCHDGHHPFSDNAGRVQLIQSHVVHVSGPEVGTVGTRTVS